MKRIINIDDKDFEIMKHNIAIDNPLCPISQKEMVTKIVNGIPLDTHDEEIIATTVESIWGKPPYTELLDKIRVEIGKCKTQHEMQIAERDTKSKLLISDIFCDVIEIINKYSR